MTKVLIYGQFAVLGVIFLLVPNMTRASGIPGYARGAARHRKVSIGSRDRVGVGFAGDCRFNNGRR
jgi:hypothetical protein